jgi:lipopolysaccharide transport system permease protein
MSATAETPLVAEIPVLRITPPSRWWVVPFGELWAYRELIYFFVWRDIKIRYKQTAIGEMCAVLRQFLTMREVYNLSGGEVRVQ